MRNLLATIIAVFALALAAGDPSAAAAQYAQQESCSVVVDGGAASTAVCGPFFTNLQPYAAVCAVTSTGNSVITTVQTQYSPNQTVSGIDGGLYGAYDAGAVQLNSISGAGGTVALSNAPVNPWNGVQFVATVIAEDGGTGTFTCNLALINAQTIHRAGSAKKK